MIVSFRLVFSDGVHIAAVKQRNGTGYNNNDGFRRRPRKNDLYNGKFLA